jgi:hypothetical protein
MPQPSKFTTERKALIVEALRLGVSDATAAMHAGIDRATLSRWLARAEKAAQGGAWHEFWLTTCEAKASARLALARSAFRAAMDDGALAWKMVSRLEPAFRVEAPEPRLPMTVQLEWHPAASIESPSSEVGALPPDGDTT